MYEGLLCWAATTTYLPDQVRGHYQKNKNQKSIVNKPLYKFIYKNKQAEIPFSTHLWHRCLGQRIPGAIEEFIKQNSENETRMLSCHRSVGHVLHKSESTLLPKSIQSKITHSLESIHSDICEPKRTHMPSGSKYLVTFMEDYSRHTVTSLVKQKNKMLEKLLELMAAPRNKFQWKLQILCTDNRRNTKERK